MQQSNLKQWIAASGSLSQTQNQLWTNTNTVDQKTLVPVPFPGDTNVRVTLKRGHTVVLDRLNDRLTGPNLADPDHFTQLNQVDQPAATNPPFRTFTPTLNSGPFAKVFTDELVAAYAQISSQDPCHCRKLNPAGKWSRIG